MGAEAFEDGGVSDQKLLLTLGLVKTGLTRRQAETSLYQLALPHGVEHRAQGTRDRLFDQQFQLSATGQSETVGPRRVDAVIDGCGAFGQLTVEITFDQIGLDTAAGYRAHYLPVTPTNSQQGSGRPR